MGRLWQKIKGSWIGSILFSCLLLFIFLGLFYVVNLDLKPAQKNTPVVQSSFGPNMDVEIKKRLGSIDVSMESYSDWAKRYGLSISNDGLDQDPDKEGLPNYLEYIYGTNPLKADTAGYGFTDKQEVENGYDPSEGTVGDPRVSVEVSIEKIGVSAPMVWSASEDEKSLLKDLEMGLSRYPKSSAPGQNGNIIISGHSSNYIWAKGNFNHIFKDLNNLEKGDLITIKTSQKNGRVIVYHYQVSDKLVTSADDQNIFTMTPDPTLTLSTCWPIGTNLKRLIVKAELVKNV